MNQKLLARLFYGFLVFMVIVALFLLNYQVKQNKKREQTGNNINVVSRVDDADIEKTAQIAKQPIINVSSMDVKTQLVEDETPVTASVSYLDVYRQLQTAQACRSFFEFWQRKGLDADITSMVRPPLKLYGDANYLSNEKAPLAAGQTEALKSWVYKCHQLWQAYGEFEQTADQLVLKNNIIDAIKQRLLVTAAKTKKEMDIKQVRQLATQWQQSFAQVKLALVGENNRSPVDVQKIQKQIEQLTQIGEGLRLQWVKVRFTNDAEAASLSLQRRNLNQQIHNLEVELIKQNVVDQDALQQALAAFQSHDLDLNVAMYSADADVFYEAMAVFHGNQMTWLNEIGFAFHSTLNNPASQYRITPDQLVFETSGWRNHIQHRFDLQYAAQLYLCDLGWDCAANSPIVMSYCLFGVNSLPAACGQNLYDFMQNDLISPNRWQDVMEFKNLYKELYNE